MPLMGVLAASGAPSGLPAPKPSLPFLFSLPALLRSLSCYSDSTEDDDVDSHHGLLEPALPVPDPNPIPGLANLHLSL